MKKRILAALMAVVLTAGLAAGCGSPQKPGEGSASGNSREQPSGSEENAQPQEEDGNSKEAADLKKIKVAIPFAETGLMFLSQLSYNLNNKLGPVANMEVIYQASALDADGILTFVESEVAAGVDGLFICPPSDAVLPTVCSLCEEAGVYWAITMRSINDEEIKAMCEASPYYVGNCYEDEENTGYLVGKYLGENGKKKVALLSTTKGDTTGDAREAGFARACKEYDIEIAGEARGLNQASDVTNAVESFLSANTDLDAVFCVGTTVAGIQEVAVKTVKDSGREGVEVVCIDHPDGIVDLFDTGILTYSVGTPTFSLDMYVCMIKLANAIQGTPISGSLDGKSTNSVEMAEIKTAEDAKAYAEAGSNPEYVFFEEEELQQMMRWNNESFDEGALQSALENYEL